METTAKATGEKKTPTKGQIVSELAGNSGLTKAQVGIVLDELGKIIKREIGKNGSGSLTLIGLAKFQRKAKAATKARVGKNPLTGEAIQIAAKPPTTVVRIRPLKPLKDAVY